MASTLLLDKDARIDLWLKQHGEQEDYLAADLRAYLGKLGRDAAARVRAGASEAELRKWLTVGRVDDELKAAAAPGLLRAGLAGAAAEWLHAHKHFYGLLLTKNSKADKPKRERDEELQAYLDKLEVRPPDDVVEAMQDWTDDLLDEPYWKDVSDSTREDVVDSLKEGVDEGKSTDEIADEIEEKLGPEGGGADRAQLIARTEVTGQLSAGGQLAREKLDEMGLLNGKTWLAILDDSVRPSHEEADQQEVGNDEPFVLGTSDGDEEEGMFPGSTDFSAENRCNCILPGAVVQGVFDATVRSVYAGQAVEVVTRAGRRLALTPQHPVLTEHGFVGAGELQAGDQLVTYDGQVDDPPPAVTRCACGDQVNHEPALIENVFDAFWLRAVVACRSTEVELRRAQVVDFHGDGQFLEGQVQIVRSHGELLVYGEAGRLQERRDAVFHFKHAELLSEDCQCSLGLSLVSIDATPGGLPGGAALSLYSGPVQPETGPLETLALRATADCDAGFLEGAKKSWPDDATGVGYRFEGFSSIISCNEIGKSLDVGASKSVRSDVGFDFAPHGDAGLTKLSANGRNRSILLLGQLRESYPGFIQLDEVLDVRERTYSGHVYDLQSPDGIIIANGIVISNCRCTAQSALVSEDELFAGMEEGKSYVFCRPADRQAALLLDLVREVCRVPAGSEGGGQFSSCDDEGGDAAGRHEQEHADLDRQHAKDDRELARAHAKEDDQAERAAGKEEAGVERQRAGEDRKTDAADSKEDRALDKARDKEDAAETAAKQEEIDAIEAGRDREYDEHLAGTEGKSEEERARLEAEYLAERESRDNAEDDAFITRWGEREDALADRREQEDNALSERRNERDGERDARREQEDAARTERVGRETEERTQRHEQEQADLDARHDRERADLYTRQEPSSVSQAASNQVANTSASPEHHDAIQKAWAALPAPVSGRLAEHGVRVVAAGRGDQVDNRGDISADRAAQANGLYSFSTKTLAVMSTTVRQGVERPNEHPAATLAHEAGHALDDALGRPSQSAEFRAAHDADVRALGADGKWPVLYFARQNPEGRMEAFAQAAGELVGQAAAVKPDFAAAFPKTKEYVAGLLAKEKLL